VYATSKNIPLKQSLNEDLQMPLVIPRKGNWNICQRTCAL